MKMRLLGLLVILSCSYACTAMDNDDTHTTLPNGEELQELLKRCNLEDFDNKTLFSVKYKSMKLDPMNLVKILDCELDNYMSLYYGFMQIMRLNNRRIFIRELFKERSDILQKLEAENLI